MLLLIIFLKIIFFIIRIRHRNDCVIVQFTLNTFLFVPACLKRGAPGEVHTRLQGACSPQQGIYINPFISMGGYFLYFLWRAGLPISSDIKYHSSLSNISIFLFFFKFVILENQKKFLLPFISMAVIFFYFLGGEGHPLSTDTKNHNF